MFMEVTVGYVNLSLTTPEAHQNSKTLCCSPMLALTAVTFKAPVDSVINC